MAAITAAVIGAGTAIYASKKAKDQQKDAQAFAEKQREYADPFEQYRPGAAAELDVLMRDPSRIENTGLYKARLQAAERTMAAQGYTGSGNALVAAADAGASAYQQEFDNLARMAGVDTGIGAASGVGVASMSSRGAANDNYLSSIAGVGNNLTNLASMFGGRTSTPTGATGGTALGTGSYTGGTSGVTGGFNAPIQVGGGG